MKANSMAELAELIRQKQWTLCSCESCTGGLFSSRLTEVPGVSAFFKGWVVTYWTEVKTNVVHVDPAIIEAEGVVSEATAKAMAEQCAELMHCDMAVAFTGNAGPDVMENKPAGMICTAIHVPGQTWTFSDLLNGTRQEVREQIVERVTERSLTILRQIW